MINWQMMHLVTKIMASLTEGDRLEVLTDDMAGGMSLQLAFCSQDGDNRLILNLGIGLQGEP